MDIQNLIKNMTIEEKAAQMTQVALNVLTSAFEGDFTGPAQDSNISDHAWESLGSILGTKTAESVIATQKEHLERDVNHIPMMFMTDVIHGFQTIYPIPLGMGATWEPELMKECCAMAAKEAAISGINVVFSPMIDLARDARWGRVMETTGEDPYLNSLYAKAQVEGYQGDLKNKYNVAACIKHFAAYGAAESGRDYNAVEMSEHTLREFFLPSYKAAVDSGVEMVMSSFNTINGVPSSGNKWLLDDVLRKEWEFDGVIISDWRAFVEMIIHGFAEDEKDVAEKALNATSDIEMMSYTYAHHLEELVSEGKISEDQIDRAVERILRLKDKLGLFDNPYRATSTEEEKTVIHCAEHRKLAEKAAVKASVLLKNDNVLPFDNVKSIAVIGPFADCENIGSWRCNGKDEEAVTTLMGIKEHFDGEIYYAAGCSGDLNAKTDKALIDEAAKIAEKADAVLLCVGEKGKMSGEAKSRAYIGLSDAQNELIRSVVTANKRTAVCLFTGRPLALEYIIDDIPALFTPWQPGTEGGYAIAKLVLGKENFSGKLTMSFPRQTGQCPIYYNQLNTGRPFVDDVNYMGYVSMYIDCFGTPLYYFGYGLSYTDFEISNVRIDKNRISENDKITVSADVKNIGTRFGETVVQMYIHDVTASIARPVKELKGFEKVGLEAGEKKTVVFSINRDTLAFYNASCERKAECGKFEVYVSDSAKTGDPIEFVME